MNKAPAERSRLYFLLAWCHATILERLQFAPVGWSKTYEFSDADRYGLITVTFYYRYRSDIVRIPLEYR